MNVHLQRATVSIGIATAVACGAQRPPPATPACASAPSSPEPTTIAAADTESVPAPGEVRIRPRAMEPLVRYIGDFSFVQAWEIVSGSDVEGWFVYEEPTSAALGGTTELRAWLHPRAGVPVVVFVAERFGDTLPAFCLYAGPGDPADGWRCREVHVGAQGESGGGGEVGWLRRPTSTHAGGAWDLADAHVARLPVQETLIRSLSLADGERDVRLEPNVPGVTIELDGTPVALSSVRACAWRARLELTQPQQVPSAPAEAPSSP